MADKLNIFTCKFCGEKVSENLPHEEYDNMVCICGDCAFKNGVISEEEYLKNYLFAIDIDKLRATVMDGEIYITTSKFPWEITNRDRGCKEYSEWRNNVFSRDNFTCVCCGQVGGQLNAHHIKEYAKYPNLRYEVDNGVTLCEKCHKEEHRRRRVNGGL